MSTMNMALIGAAIGLLILLLVMRRRAAAQEAAGGSARPPKRAPKPPKAHRPPKPPKAPKAGRRTRDAQPKSARPRPERRWLGRRRRPSEDGPPAPPEPRPLSATSETLEGVETAPFAEVAPEQTVPAGDATLAEVAAAGLDDAGAVDGVDAVTVAEADDWDDGLRLPTEPGPDEPDWDAMRSALSGTPAEAAPGEPPAAEESHPITEEWDLQAEAEAAAPRAWADDDLITEPGWPLPGDVEDWQSDAEPFASDEPAAAEPVVAEDDPGWLGEAHDVAPAAAPWTGGDEDWSLAAEPAEDAEVWSAADEPAWAEVAAVQDAAPASEPDSDDETEAGSETDGEAGGWILAEAPADEWTAEAGEWDDPVPAAVPEAEAAGDDAWWSDEEPQATEAAETVEAAEAWEPGEPAGAVDWLGGAEPDAVADVAAPEAQDVPTGFTAAEAVAAPEPEPEPRAVVVPRPPVDAALDAVAAPEDAWWDEPAASEPVAAAAPVQPTWWEEPAGAAPETRVVAEVAATLAPEPVAVAAEDPEHMSGRFALGGTALRPGHEALTGVTFRAPLQRAPRGWALGGDSHTAGTLVLSVDATMNCAPEGLEVLFSDGMAPSVDGFTLKLTALGAGPFAVSGRFHVVP
jgi:hypothetical protein